MGCIFNQSPRLDILSDLGSISRKDTYEYDTTEKSQ